MIYYNESAGVHCDVLRLFSNKEILEEYTMIELGHARNELENTAKKLVDFRG